MIANIECTTSDTVSTYHNGYSYITVDSCVFEITDWFNLDFSCSRIRNTSTLSAHDVIVTNNLIKGAGAGNSGIGYSLCLESPYNVLVSGNTIWRSTWAELKFAYQDQNGVTVYDGGNIVIDDNVFQLDYNNGLTHTGDNIYFTGNDIDFTNNTIVRSQGDVHGLLELCQLARDRQHVKDTRSSGAGTGYQFVDTTHCDDRQHLQNSHGVRPDLLHRFGKLGEHLLAEYPHSRLKSI